MHEPTAPVESIRSPPICAFLAFPTLDLRGPDFETHVVLFSLHSSPISSVVFSFPPKPKIAIPGRGIYLERWMSTEIRRSSTMTSRRTPPAPLEMYLQTRKAR